jgi:hypothetical protein
MSPEPTPFLSDALTLALTSRPCWLRRSKCSQARPVEDDFGLRLDLGSRPLRGASELVADRGYSRWPCFRAVLDRRSTSPLCVLAGAVGPSCIVFGSVVDWELAALHSCSVLLVEQDVRAGFVI